MAKKSSMKIFKKCAIKKAKISEGSNGFGIIGKSKSLNRNESPSLNAIPYDTLRKQNS